MLKVYKGQYVKPTSPLVDEEDLTPCGSFWVSTFRSSYGAGIRESCPAFAQKILRDIVEKTEKTGELAGRMQGGARVSGQMSGAARGAVNVCTQLSTQMRSASDARNAENLR